MHHNRIYIAEDKKDLQQGLQRALIQSGFDVRVFDSGYPLVSMMDNWPDAFVIDIELPGINGLEVCKWLKSHDKSRNIPVIFLSSDSYLKILAASANADDYIELPTSYTEMADRIKTHLSNGIIAQRLADN